MSKAKQQAYHYPQQQQHQQQYHLSPPSSSSFASGFIFGQLLLAFILFVFIKFFIFGDAPSADERATARAAARRRRTLSHKRTFSAALRPRPTPVVLKPRTDGGPTVQKILEKSYYNVYGHQPESLDWFNVLIAQTIAQLRADAQEDEAVLESLTRLLNGPSKPDFVDEIHVTEISLGDEFPIFSNCRVIPVDENGSPLKELTGQRGERLQARMDVDLGDVLTLGIETKLLLNYPKPFVMVLPVALAVSVVRFSGTLSVSFSPGSHSNPDPGATGNSKEDEGFDRTPAGQSSQSEGHPLNPTGRSPTTLTFTFLDDYRLDLSVHSLIGSRSRLQDVPKIAQLVEGRIHQWFDDRCVEPRFQQIVLPSLWPRKKNTRGGDEEAVMDDSITSDNKADYQQSPKPGMKVPNPDPLPAEYLHSKRGFNAGTRETTAEQRTRDWAAQHGTPAKRRDDLGGRKKDQISEIELAGQEMREADERDRRKALGRARNDHDRNEESLGPGMRISRESGHENAASSLKALS